MASYIIGLSTIYSLLNNCDNTEDTVEPIPPQTDNTVNITINLFSDKQMWNNVIVETENYALSTIETESEPYKITGITLYFDSVDSITHTDNLGGELSSSGDTNENGLITLTTGRGIFILNTSTYTFEYQSLSDIATYGTDTDEIFTIEGTIKGQPNTQTFIFTFVPMS